MAYSTLNLFNKAVDITKEYAKGGGETRLELVLRDIFEELKKMNEELE